MNNPRIVKVTKLTGLFPLPLGLTFRGYGPGEHVKSIDVSTVCLENGHLEDPMGLVDPEHGYETMVFFEGCTFFGLYQRHYTTKVQAQNGHRWVVQQLIAGKLPLAIQLPHYVAREEQKNDDRTAGKQKRKSIVKKTLKRRT